jgi:uncharacterized membrane protein
MNIILVLVAVMTQMINYRTRGITTHCSFVVYLTMLSVAEIMLLLNYWMTLKNEFDRRWKAASCDNLRNCSSICLECLRSIRTTQVRLICVPLVISTRHLAIKDKILFLELT